MWFRVRSCSRGRFHVRSHGCGVTHMLLPQLSHGGEGDAVDSLRLETLASGTSAEFEVPHGVTAAPSLIVFGHT
jgi:hypothetical protein